MSHINIFQSILKSFPLGIFPRENRTPSHSHNILEKINKFHADPMFFIKMYKSYFDMFTCYKNIFIFLPKYAYSFQ